MWKRTVSGSTISTRLMARTYCAKDEGEFGTVGTRAMVKATSSAVKSCPLWNFTPGRSLNSQVVSSTGRQDRARPGRGRTLASVATSVPKTIPATPELGVRLW